MVFPGEQPAHAMKLVDTKVFTAAIDQAAIVLPGEAVKLKDAQLGRPVLSQQCGQAAPGDAPDEHLCSSGVRIHEMAKGSSGFAGSSTGRPAPGSESTPARMAGSRCSFANLIRALKCELQILETVNACIHNFQINKNKTAFQHL
jgi:hypothetical protein